MKVRAAMTRTVSCLSPNQTLREAYDLMTESGFRHVPIVEDDVLNGIISDREILLRAGINADGGVAVPDSPIADAMTKNLITCGPTALISDIANVMIESKIDAMPVTDSEGNMLGLVTSTDILALVSNREHNFIRSRIPWDWRLDRMHPSVARKEIKYDNDLLL